MIKPIPYVLRVEGGRAPTSLTTISIYKLPLLIDNKYTRVSRYIIVIFDHICL